MKGYMTGYYQSKQHPSQVVEHMFCTLGNGVGLNNKGYISENYRSDEIFEFPEPTAFAYMYPWSNTEEFQPFRKLAGCRDVGFKETCQYFFSCLELTPDSTENAKKWKDNIELMRSILLETPAIQDKIKDKDDMSGFISLLSGKDTSYSSKWDKEPDGESSVYKVWFFDVQWSDCPDEVQDEVRHAWSAYELGNDKYIIKRELDDELFEDYPLIYMWLKHKGVKENEKVIIHWWW